MDGSRVVIETDGVDRFTKSWRIDPLEVPAIVRALRSLADDIEAGNLPLHELERVH